MPDVVFFFPHGVERRLAPKRPRRGMRVRGSGGDAWIVDTVTQSGTDTYSAHCIAPHDVTDRRARVVAYVWRDREFVSTVLLLGALLTWALTNVTSVSVALITAASVGAFLCVAWATTPRDGWLAVKPFMHKEYARRGMRRHVAKNVDAPTSSDS